MTAVEFMHLSKILRSLRDCTSLDILDLRSGLQVELGGRCSPYLSHRTVAWKQVEGPHSWGASILFLGNYRLGLQAHGFVGQEQLEEFLGEKPSERLVTSQVPHGLLEGLLEEAFQYGIPFLEGTGMPWVTLPLPLLAGWHGDGRPVRLDRSAAGGLPSNEGGYSHYSFELRPEGEEGSGILLGRYTEKDGLNLYVKVEDGLEVILEPTEKMKRPTEGDDAVSIRVFTSPAREIVIRAVA